jgi:hypothetical protein
MNKVIYIFSLLTIFNTYLFAQKQDSVLIPKNNLGFAEYSEVIIIDSISKNDLYLSALDWMSKTYKSGKNVIQITDKEGGMIIGKAATQTLIYNNMGAKKDGGYFSYTISIYFKDYKYKYVIDNITYVKGEMALKPGADLAEKFPHNWTGLIGNNKQTRREWKSFQNQADSEFKAIIEDFKKHIRNTKQKNGW